MMSVWRRISSSGVSLEANGVTYGTGPSHDLYAQYAANPTLFKALTNFTPVQFDMLMDILLDASRPKSYLLKPRDVRGLRALDRQRGCGGRPHKLTARTRVFLCLVRLKDDDRLARLCAMSGLNVASVCQDFWHVVECLLAATEDNIRWPDPSSRRSLASVIPPLRTAKFPIGVVDGTAQFIRRPGADEPLFYNGRKKRHFFNHLVVCDWRGRILAVRTGFTGKTHDGVAYRASNLFTRSTQFFGPDQTLLADNGFEACGLITPFKNQRGGGALSSEQKYRNRLIRRYRVVVEFLFGAMKTKFGMISGIWRHSLPRANMVFMLCCQLMNFYMATNRKYIRGERFVLNHMSLEAWEEALLRGTGNDWAQTSRERVRDFFNTMEGQNILQNF